MSKAQVLKFNDLPRERPVFRAARSSRNARLNGSLIVSLIVTALVLAFPALVAWRVQQQVAVGGLFLSVAAAMFASVLVMAFGSIVWQRLPFTGDRVFADVMLWGWIRRGRAERQLAAVEELMADRRVVAIDLHTDVLVNLTNALEDRDHRTHGHSRRVARHAAGIAKEMGLSDEEVARIRIAAAVHDVGKIKTPDAILFKQGKLTEEEFQVIKQHSVDGEEMITFTGENELASIVRHHHERVDGTGYPDGLAAEKIPLGARIIAVADTFDAITSDRVYRAHAEHSRACKTLVAQSGSQLDGEAVDAFIAYYGGGRKAFLWGAFTAAPPRIAQAGLDLLRGSAATTVAAAAVVATAGVASHGVPAQQHKSHESKAAPVAATSTVTHHTTKAAPPAAKKTKTHKKWVDRRPPAKAAPATTGSGTDSSSSGSNSTPASSGSADSGSSSTPTKTPATPVVELPDLSDPNAVPDLVNNVGGAVGGTLTETTKGVNDTVTGILNRGK